MNAYQQTSCINCLLDIVSITGQVSTICSVSSGNNSCNSRGNRSKSSHFGEVINHFLSRRLSQDNK